MRAQYVMSEYSRATPPHHMRVADNEGYGCAFDEKLRVHLPRLNPSWVTWNRVWLVMNTVDSAARAASLAFVWWRSGRDSLQWRPGTRCTLYAGELICIFFLWTQDKFWGILPSNQYLIKEVQRKQQQGMSLAQMSAALAARGAVQGNGAQEGTLSAQAEQEILDAWDASFPWEAVEDVEQNSAAEYYFTAEVLCGDRIHEGLTCHAADVTRLIPRSRSSYSSSVFLATASSSPASSRPLGLSRSPGTCTATSSRPS